MAKVNAGIEESSAKSGKFGAAFAGAGLLAMGALTGIVGIAGAAIAKTEAAGQAAFEMSEKFGLSGQKASEYLVVGKQLGLSGEQIGKGFQFLSKNVSGMALTLEAGGKISATTGQVYKDLGIKVLDAGGKVKSADELMLEAADAFKGMADGPEKAALSMKLFGKSGTDMLPMLNQGRAGIEAMMKAGKAQGDVMSNDQVAAAHKLFLAHKQLDTAIAGVTTQIGTALMPVMTGLMSFVMNTAVPWIQNAIKVMTSWHGLWEAVGTVAGITFGILKVGWGVLIDVIGAVSRLVGWIASLKLLWSAVVLVFQASPFGFIVTHLTQVRDVIGGIVDAIQGVITWIKNMATAFSNSGIVKGIGAVTGVAHTLHIPGFQFGGIVPGPYLGAPSLILAHAGETVTPRGQAGGGDRTVLMPIVYGPMSSALQRLIDIDLRDRLRRLDKAQT
jgi:hypothetical protein